jgi:hypothetical protein
MNKVELGFQGGHPFVLDDLEFMQNALTEGIKGLASFFQTTSSDPVIISGLTTSVVGPNTVWTNGFICVNQEIYFVLGGTFTTGSSMVIDIAQTIDTNGDKTFENLVVNSTYTVRRGILKVDTGSPTEVDITDFITIMDRLASIGCLRNSTVGWVNVPTFASTWGNGGSYTTGVCRYRKNAMGSVELCGGAKITTSSLAGETIFTLPVAYRPIENKIFTCIGRDGSNYYAPLILIVFTNGLVTVGGHTVGNTVEAYLHTINFTLD